MKIFVANLNFEVTEREIATLFETYGTVHHVHIVTGRGFGFVGMARRSGVVAVQELDGLQFHGRPITVKEAVDQKRNRQSANLRQRS